MATGILNLPYPGKAYSPFDILTAEELNEDVANIESLADGSGVGDGAIPALKIDFATYPRFAAVPSSNQAIGATSTIVNFGTELYDVGGNFSGNTFTAPVDGYYHFDIQLGNAAIGRLALFIIANGTNLYGSEQWIPAGTAAGNNVSTSYDIYLQVGHTVGVQAACDVTRTLIAARCRFSGHLIALG